MSNNPNDNSNPIPEQHPDLETGQFEFGTDDELDVGDGQFVLDGVNCENCAHSDVCQLYGAAVQNNKQYEQQHQQESPVDAGILAVGCDLFEYDGDD